MKKTSFPPIRDSQCVKLILGTMPGEISLRSNQYYAHKGNQFWKIMFSIFGKPFSENYEARKRILLENKIALWDVLMNCEREGSSDNAISLEQPNDFKKFFEENPLISSIYFNGNNAADYFNHFIKPETKQKFSVLPSTSPANTWKTFEEKVSEWKVIAA
jgi:hypoxanthine-DNA glycosylase